MVSKRENHRNLQNPNAQQIKPEGQHRHDRPRLHDMPYNTNWKDGRPIDNNRKQPYGKDTPDPLKRNMAHMAENKPWCFVCNLPHSPEYCEVAKSIQQEEMLYSYNRDNHTINMMQDTPCVVTEDYSSLEEEGYEYDVGNQKYHINMGEQQVFSD